MKKFRIIVICIIALGAAVFAYTNRVTIKEWFQEEPIAEDTNAVSFAEIKNTANTNVKVNANTNAVAIPDTFNLKVPFTTQAPDANWDEVHEETCEEASAITVHYYYEGKTFTTAIAEKELQDFVAYENRTLGFYKDTTAEQTADLMKSYWGYDRVDVIENPTALQIKEHIAAGRPVIVPSAGRQLGNPNFKAPGPLYHMLVIRGYTKTEFITNDVGTRKGENYRYSIETIMNALHDWNGGDVDNGAKRIIVAYPKD